MTSLNENIFPITGPLFEEFTGHSPHKGQWRGAFFYLRLNKRLRNQSWCWNAYAILAEINIDVSYG